MRTFEDTFSLARPQPIWIYFHIVKDSLDDEAIEKHISKESFGDFKNRVLRTFSEMDTVVIDKTIESMSNRVLSIIEGKGCRTKY